MSPEEKAAAVRIVAAVEAEVDVLTSKGHLGLAALEGFVLVTQWRDVEADADNDEAIWLSRLKKPGTSDALMNGLLFEALHGDWSGD